jgi:hypothetical protein
MILLLQVVDTEILYIEIILHPNFTGGESGSSYRDHSTCRLTAVESLQ